MAEGKLIHRPSAYRKVSERNMILTPYIDALAQQPFADTIEGERYAALAQYLDGFSELHRITVAQNPDKKPNDVMLARVHPVGDDFWSMRITAPEDTPGIRLLGGFCARDSFVGLLCEFRDYISVFDEEVDETRNLWRDLFGDLKPLSGSNLDDYLTHYREY
ncbi:MAG: hypothetical protein E5X35_31350 [Mesorhizobium sp.]|uniref:hypothetical protein n=1 Tax=Mesorhizobium sp. TaxID=1871066 RepID=UPI00121EF872|nr:hypothetical protein [Mesorhizobium sp.]TIR28283.1 MAG: hypothetical protein E5X35_31350 [Mesorhizobium sp.]